VESGGHGGGERVTVVDHQGDQEPYLTRGNDEALEIMTGAALLERTLIPSVPFASWLHGGDNLRNYCIGVSHKCMTFPSILCIE